MRASTNPGGRAAPREIADAAPESQGLEKEACGEHEQVAAGADGRDKVGEVHHAPVDEGISDRWPQVLAKSLPSGLRDEWVLASDTAQLRVQGDSVELLGGQRHILMGALENQLVGQRLQRRDHQEEVSIQSA